MSYSKLSVILASLTVFVLAGLFLWQPIALQYQLLLVEQQFRESYRIGSHYCIMISDLDWVCEFGGRCGLQCLRRLAVDPRISETGRQMVRRWIPFMEHDIYLAYCPDGAKGSPYSGWPVSAYLDYVTRVSIQMSERQKKMEMEQDLKVN